VGRWTSSLEGLVLSNRCQIKPAFWAGKRVLVTGHTGFKGSWLCLWLSQLGAEVSGLGLEPDTSPSLFSELQLDRSLHNHWITDIRDLHSLAHLVEACQPQVVLHLAAQPLVRRSYRDPLGTWATNVQGSLHVLEALRSLQHPCAVVMVTTDKVYENQEWDYGYRESDRLGGSDPYSASKAAAEIAIKSWRLSFCGSAPHQQPNLAIATARAGNVIGGGDWAEDRIVPDLIRSISENKPLSVRNPSAVRPWQHVLEPLSGYLRLAQELSCKPESVCEAFNFGPNNNNNLPVRDLVEESLRYWPGVWTSNHDSASPHEATLLHLQTDKAWRRLGWTPVWNFEQTVEKTLLWYINYYNGKSAIQCCLEDLSAFADQNNF
jgi:CDP-glucose 4,6-dehydratase